MIYQAVSIKQVIARVIRNMRLQDDAFILSMDEWIPEAMGIMNTKQQVSPHYEDVNIHFHKGRMPSDLHSVMAIEYEGQNLVASHNTLAAPILPYKTQSGSNLFTTVPDYRFQQHPDNESSIIYDGHAIQFVTTSASYCLGLPTSSHWYQCEPGFITTSVREGCLRVHYKRIPVDEDGLPLVPDNENFKQALYWYCRWMIIGAGYRDNAFNAQYCEAQFEKYAGRAISEITYPTDAELESAVINSNKLIKDESYFQRFFGNDDATPGRLPYGGLNPTSYQPSDRYIPNVPPNTP